MADLTINNVNNREAEFNFDSDVSNIEVKVRAFNSEGWGEYSQIKTASSLAFFINSLFT